MAYQDVEESCRFMDESDGDEDEQAQHPGEGRDGDEEYTNWKQHPRGLHASGEGTGQVEEQELEEIVFQGQYDDNLVTTEQGRDGADSQGRARHPLDGEVDKEGQESDEEPEVTDPLLPEPPGAAAPQVSEADVEGGKREEENSETQSLLQGSLGQSVSGARTQGSPNVRGLDPEEEGNSGCGEQTDGTNQNRGTYAGGDGRGDGEENTDGTNQHRGTDTARDGRGDGEEHTDGTNQPGGKDAGGDGRGNGEEHTDGTNQPGGKDAVGDGRGNGEEHTDGTNQPGGKDAGGDGRGNGEEHTDGTNQLRGTDAAGKGRVQAGEQPGTAVQGGLVTGWNPSELFEAIKHKLGVLEASVRGVAIDVSARIDEFDRNTDLLTDDQRQQIVAEQDMILNTDTETRDMIREWDRQCGVNHDLSIDCILGEKFMIKQLAKFRQRNSVKALLDVILAEGGSKKTEKDDKWADLFNQLGGLMLLEVFGDTDLLEKIITNQCCNPSELVKGFVQVMKQASETTPMYCDMDRGFLGSTIDGSIAAIVFLMKKDSSKLLKYLRDILNDLDAIWSKWMAEHEEEHADIEESEQKEEDTKKEKDSQRNHDLSIDCILGEKVMIKQLAKFRQNKSVKALLDVILAEGDSKKTEKDDKWANLFNQLGGLMLLQVFGNTDLLKNIITSQCGNPSELVKGFVQVMKQASETTTMYCDMDRGFLGSTIDGSIAEIMPLMKTDSSKLLKYLRDILNDLDAIWSKWMAEHEEEHADVEESEQKEEDAKKEKDSQRNQDLSIDCILGETNMIKQLVKFDLTESVEALLDVILAEGGSKKKDAEWAELFKQLGGLMLLHTFARTDILKRITTSQCCKPSELVKGFVQVMKQESETTSQHLSMSRGVLGTTIDGSIAAIIFLMKTNASWLLRYLKDILKDLDAIFSKWTDEQEEEHADVEESEKKEDDKQTEKDSLKTESLNITCFRGEHNDIITKLVEFDLTKSVKVLLGVLLSAEDDGQVEDGEWVDEEGEWVDLFKQLGPNMLPQVFDENSVPLFMEIIKSERWCKNASVAETIFDGMRVKSYTAFGLLDAPVDQDKDSTKTVFTELATSCNSLCSHDLFQWYTNAKWEQLGPYCILLFVLYLCMTFSLIYTLVTSVIAVNVHIYESGLDHSRLVFEVIAAISVIGCLLIELFQIQRDWTNWLELLSSLLLCISIPLRFKAEHVHWYLFAFGYILWIPQWRKQSVVFKKFYIQAEVFVQVLKHDVPWFSLLFMVINIAFAGASYLTLRGENNLHVDNQTSSFPEIFFMGVRTLAEGQPVLEYYGNEEYRAMSIVVMVVFLFAMCVILLNLLIAQISKTLDKNEIMDNYYHIRLAFTLAWMDILLPKCCKKLGKTEERWKNFMARPRLYTEKIISKTEKMRQHLAKIAGDLQDVSQTVKDNDVQTTRRKQTVGGDVLDIGARKHRRESKRREEWNTKLKDEETHEKKVLDFIDKCIKDGHNPAEWMVDGECPLYVAIVKNRAQVLRRLLSLLDPTSTDANKRKANALYKALTFGNRFNEAALLVNSLKESEPKRVLDCFDNGVILYNDCDYSNQDFWLAFLTVMMIQKDISLFDKNVEGEVAEGAEPTIFHRLAAWGNTTVFKHPALGPYIKKKWEECGRKKQFLFDMMIYLLTLICLTVVVVLSGQAEDVNIYKTNTDRTRLGFEIVSASLILYTLVKEVLELISTLQAEFKYGYASKTRRQSERQWWFIRKLQEYAVWRGIRAYWKDHFNKAECTSALLLLPVTITARLLDTNAFWYIFAFGYFLWVMIVFKYASIHRELSTYAQSLWIIITTDVFYFLVLFAVVNLAFSGFFVLILKGENIIHVQKETSTFWGTLFFGVRALTDGQNSLNYYDADGGPDGYNTFLTVATMVVFLFVVIVILSNILIAQLSRSYYKAQEDAEAAALVRKARDIARLERFEWPYCFGTLKGRQLIPEQFKPVDFKKYENIKSTTTIENVDSLLNKLAEVESNVVGLKAEAARCKKQWSTERKHLETTITRLERQDELSKLWMNYT